MLSSKIKSARIDHPDQSTSTTVPTAKSTETWAAGIETTSKILGEFLKEVNNFLPNLEKKILGEPNNLDQICQEEMSTDENNDSPLMMQSKSEWISVNSESSCINIASQQNDNVVWFYAG